MVFTERDKRDIAMLITLLNEVIDYLKKDGCGEGAYALLKKSINTLENKEVNGFLNLRKHISSDFRMMADRGQYGEDIDPITDEIYRIIKSNALFNGGI